MENVEKLRKYSADNVIQDIILKEDSNAYASFAKHTNDEFNIRENESQHKLVIQIVDPKVQSRHHFSALPSVTPTAKPAVSPVAGRISGSTGESFMPCVAADAKDLTIDRFRKLLDEEGFQILGANETGDPNGNAWTEFGNLDSTGHKEGIGLANRIPELIASVVYRIESLLAAGWREIRIVTDHGWLLLPKLPVLIVPTSPVKLV